MKMPLHHSTKDAVIVVLKGETVLKMLDVVYSLVQNTSFIIPAGVEHSLRVNQDFHAIVIMENDSVIEFKD